RGGSIGRALGRRLGGPWTCVLVVVVAGGGAAALVHRYAPSPAYLVATAAGLVLLCPLYRAVRAILDLVARVRVRGRVPARTLANDPATKRDARFYLVVDDGRPDPLTPWPPPP